MLRFQLCKLIAFTLAPASFCTMPHTTSNLQHTASDFTASLHIVQSVNSVKAFNLCNLRFINAYPAGGGNLLIWLSVDCLIVIAAFAIAWHPDALTSVMAVIVSLTASTRMTCALLAFRRYFKDSFDSDLTSHLGLQLSLRKIGCAFGIKVKPFQLMNCHKLLCLFNQELSSSTLIIN